MKRGAPLRRPAPPPSRARVKQYEGRGPAPRAPAMARPAPARPHFPAPKEAALQHAGYMAAVRRLPCARCGFFRKGAIQFCHADEGKGAGIKTDCRRGWPGCGPHDGLPGCHWFVGSSGRLPKQRRRVFEAQAGAAARAAIRARGLWPAALPAWEEDGDAADA